MLIHSCPWQVLQAILMGHDGLEGLHLCQFLLLIKYALKSLEGMLIPYTVCVTMEFPSYSSMLYELPNLTPSPMAVWCITAPHFITCLRSVIQALSLPPHSGISEWMKELLNIYYPSSPLCFEFMLVLYITVSLSGTKAVITQDVVSVLASGLGLNYLTGDWEQFLWGCSPGVVYTRTFITASSDDFHVWIRHHKSDTKRPTVRFLNVGNTSLTADIKLCSGFPFFLPGRRGEVASVRILTYGQDNH